MFGPYKQAICRSFDLFFNRYAPTFIYIHLCNAFFSYSMAYAIYLYNIYTCCLCVKNVCKIVCYNLARIVRYSLHRLSRL